MASAWLTAPLTPLSAHCCNEFRSAVLFRLGYAGPNPNAITKARCTCGFPTINANATTVRGMFNHALGCVHNGAVTKRHHKVRDALMDIMTKAGNACKPEDHLTESGSHIMDISASAAVGQSLMIDITVINGLAISNAGKTLPALAAEKHKEKAKKYDELAKERGFTFQTFAIEAHGTMTEETLSFLQQLNSDIQARTTDAADRTTFKTTITPISRALAFGNGLCLLWSGCLNRAGVVFGNRPKRITLSCLPDNTDADSDNASATPGAGVASGAAMGNFTAASATPGAGVASGAAMGNFTAASATPGAGVASGAAMGNFTPTNAAAGHRLNPSAAPFVAANLGNTTQSSPQAAQQRLAAPAEDDSVNTV